MITIARLFGKSPFAPLQTHMKKVSSCMKKLSEVFAALLKQEIDKVDSLAKELSKLEHEADLTKNDIRNHLPKSLFLPIDRSEMLDMLAIQDTLADKAEDIALLLTLHPLKVSQELKDGLSRLFDKNIEAFWDTRKIVKEMNDLLESSFGGLEAEKVKGMIELTSYKEHEADKLKHELLKLFFKESDSTNAAQVYLYTRLVDEINAISHTSEMLANRIRNMLELK